MMSYWSPLRRSWVVAIATTLVALGGSAVPARAADTQIRTVSYVQPNFDPAQPTTALVQSETLEPANPDYELTTSYSYDAHGNRVGTTVSGVQILTRSTTTTYDASGRFPATSTDALGHTAQFTYDPALGLLTGSTDPNGLTATTTYDEWGRKLTVVGPNQIGMRWVYHLCTDTLDAGDPPCVGNAVYFVASIPTNFASGAVQIGPKSWVYYDALDRQVRAAVQRYDPNVDGRVAFVDTTYDHLGRVVSTTQPYFTDTPTAYRALVSTQTFDAFGRMVTKTYPDAATEHVAYAGFVTSLTDALNRTTVTSKTSVGQLASVVDAAGFTTSYAYDAFGNQIKVVAPDGIISTAQYNIRGWKIASADEDRGARSWAYDALGEVIVQVDAKGNATYAWYDAIGRLTTRQVNLPDGSTDTIDVSNYDPTGAIGKLGSTYRWQDGAYQYGKVIGYDQYLRATATLTRPDASASYLTTLVAYDGNGLVHEVTRPSGLSIGYTYSGLENTLTAITNLDTATTIWTFGQEDEAGRIVKEEVVNGFYNYRSYDLNRGWLTTTLATTLTGDKLAGEQIAREANGRVLARCDVANQFRDVANYDSLDRMTSQNTGPVAVTSYDTTQAWLGGVTRQNFGCAATGGAATSNSTMTYDASGGILTKLGTGNPGTFVYGAANSSCASQGAPVHAVKYVQGGSQGHVDYCYDAAGNVVARGNLTVAYNGSNMVKQLTQGAVTALLTYTPGNARAKEVVGSLTTNYVSLDSLDHEEQQVGASSTTWVDYIYAPTGLVASVHKVVPTSGTTTVTTYGLLTDSQGSVRVVAVAGSPPADSRSYDPWGKQRFTNGAPDTTNSLLATASDNRGFIGQEQMNQFALINLNARLYDPWLGRFMSPDPVLGIVGNGQTLNPYTYGLNRPLVLSDPDGQCPICIIAIAAAAVTLDIAVDHGRLVRPIIAIAVVVLLNQPEFLPAALGSTPAVGWAAAATAAQPEALVSVSIPTGLAGLSGGLQALDIAITGAIGGAINTGTLRGALIGAATAEAFWGVGGVKEALNINVAEGITAHNAGAILVSGGLHAAVGCVSRAVSGGQCGNGAIESGLGDVFGNVGFALGANKLTVGVIAALGGGTGSALTGGKFGDGFTIALAGYAYNFLLHGRDLSAEEGQKIADAAPAWNGTPYASAGTALAGANAQQGIGADCSGSTCAIYGQAGYSYPYTSTSDFSARAGAEGFPFRALGPTETPQPGDVALYPGHMIIYAPNMSIPGRNSYSAFRPGSPYGPASSTWFGTPKFYRYQVPSKP